MDFLRNTLTIAATAATLSLTLMPAAPAEAAFIGLYDPSNFVLKNLNANGSVNTAGAPAFITLTGGNGGSGAGSTTYTGVAAADGIFSFDWLYETTDGPSSDPFVAIAGNITQLINGSGSNTQSGTFSRQVLAGDTIGWGINTNNINGAPTVTISGFNAPTNAVPEPFTVVGSVIGGAAAWQMRKKLAASVKA